MTVGRTHDAHLYFDSGSEMIELNNVLGLTVNGELATSRESYLGEEYEQASVHAAGGGVTFSTLYATSGFDALVLNAASTPNTETDFLILCPEAPASWQLIPVSWPRPSYSAPEADAITRPWNLQRRGRGTYGTRITPFDQTNTSASTIASSFGPTGGNKAAIVITSITGTATSISIAGRTGVPVYSNAGQRRPGIRPFDVASGAAANLTLAFGGASRIQGFVLQGQEEVLPNG